MQQIQFWTINMFLSMGLLAGLKAINQNTIHRAPAQINAQYTLKILKIGHSQQFFKDWDQGVYLRLRAGDERFEFAKESPLEFSEQLTHFEPQWSATLNSKTTAQRQFPLKLDIVKKKGFFEQVLLSCAIVAKKINEYDRNYHCFSPMDEREPLLTYRLEKSDVQPVLLRSVADRK